MKQMSNIILTAFFTVVFTVVFTQALEKAPELLVKKPYKQRSTGKKTSTAYASSSVVEAVFKVVRK